MSTISFITHGGGPWPIISLPGMAESERVSMYQHFQSLGEGAVPKALLVVSAHWEADAIYVNTNPAPSLYYDYMGFPDEAYRLSWAPQVDLSLSEVVADVLNQAGFSVKKDRVRGFDHGVFVPLSVAYPKVEIPIVQISIHHSLDPDLHLNLGKALSVLVSDGYSLITTGNSYHNLRRIFNPTPQAIAASEDFDAWLVETLQLPESRRWEALLDWSHAPHAYECHPREEHLIPLFVAVGAAGGTPLIPFWQGHMNGLNISSFSTSA